MDLFDLTGKTAFITGASSGLGNQFARTLSAAGARVIIAARRVDRIEALAKELKNALAVELDVRDKTAVKAAIEKLDQAGEKIDICINNAGYGWHTGIFEEDERENFEKIVQTNLLGLWYVTKAVANHMKKHGIEGAFINIASVAGANGVMKYNTAYCATKAAVIQLTKALVGELADEKIRINCILPGFFPTEMTAFMLRTEEGKKAMVAGIPLGFLSETSDMEGLILYLSSNKASRYVSGAAFTIDGGASWGGQRH